MISSLLIFKYNWILAVVWKKCKTYLLFWLESVVNTKGNVTAPPQNWEISSVVTGVPPERTSIGRYEQSHLYDFGQDRLKSVLFWIFCVTIYLLFVLFLASWLDMSNLDTPTELHSATQGISAIALILGLVLAGLVAGVVAIWKKLQVGHRTYWQFYVLVCTSILLSFGGRLGLPLLRFYSFKFLFWWLTKNSLMMSKSGFVRMCRKLKCFSSPISPY